ncbi:MAG: cupin domain-containing protein [Candidatus Heimdallarchaeota archaeon]|nr:cupin domain-containing protein [Candidatus Heimdallarchaeota archaeon]MCK4771066.1 cupin domain-containing protein [Candidatus Heimdallarchaeota archaeon]
MSEEDIYSINTEIQFDYMDLIDIRELITKSQKKWQNYSLCRVNDSVVRLGIIQGEFHWHKHDTGDEFFLVLEGRLIIEFEDTEVELSPLQSIVVPKGLMHKTKAPKRTSILMIEDYLVKPTGD